MRLRALALVSVCSLALLGGCGDDGGDDSPEAQTFCSVVAPIQALPTVLENYEDVAGVQKTMTDAEAALAAVSGTPPEGIAADVGVVTAAFGPANDVLKAAGYDYGAVVSDADAAKVAALTEPDFQTAADNIQAWSTENC
jgi:hypothetical protein